MPAAYAHHRFGSDCIAEMPEKLQNVCLIHRELFDFGVHGPDIFFYYDPLSSNEVNRYGSDLHHHPGRDIFGPAREIFRESADKSAVLAYILGFLCHFTLDSCAHGYINRMAEELPWSHNQIESDYEVYLMKRDGLDPMKVNRADPLHPSGRTAEVISRFTYFTPKQVLKTLKGQKQVLSLFHSPLQGKKRIVRALIGALKMKGDFGDLFLDREPREECVATSEEIAALQDQALELYPELLAELIRYLDGRGELGEYFDHDFEGGIVTSAAE